MRALKIKKKRIVMARKKFLHCACENVMPWFVLVAISIVNVLFLVHSSLSPLEKTIEAICVGFVAGYVIACLEKD